MDGQHVQSPGSRERLNVSHQSSDAAPLTLGFLLTWQEMGTIQELSVQQQLDISQLSHSCHVLMPAFTVTVVLQLLQTAIPHTPICQSVTTLVNSL